MSAKCISSCVCLISFCFLFFYAYLVSTFGPLRKGDQVKSKTTTVTFLDLEVQCDFSDLSDDPQKLRTPSIESIIPASAAEEDQEFRLTGLAVFSKLANACCPLADVNKARIQINKIALISLANETVCPLQAQLVRAQNAGYSVVIFIDDFVPHSFNTSETELQDKLLIPVLHPYGCHLTNYSYHTTTGQVQQDNKFITDSYLSAADRTKIEISVVMNNQQNTILMKMREYLRRLYYWFLLGPLITLEWLRRRKQLCCMSGDHHAEGGRLPEETAVESMLNTAADHEDTQRNYNQETEHEETRGETQPLLFVLNDPSTSVTRNGHTRRAPIRRVLTYLGKMFGNLAIGFYYVILIVVALPVGISSGGWSFFRFDENEIQQMTFWNDLITSNYHYHIAFYHDSAFLSELLTLFWSPIQIFCFFLYSRFACETTWTIPTNFSKLIRSDWFSSIMYSLILGVVVPFCTLGDSLLLLGYFTSCNTVCTICNLLFVLILNKHKFVTRYVFYISVCMICAYIESDIVAVFYFMMNSKGSLINLKLTALRTVAIGLTLTLSFSTSMHIIRKLTKPRESLLEGLGEK